MSSPLEQLNSRHFLCLAIFLSLAHVSHCSANVHSSSKTLFFEIDEKSIVFEFQMLATWPDPSTPPVWPDRFSVDFEELMMMGSNLLSQNTGSWHYDFGQHTARFDHNRGQKNNFCGGQGLSPDDPTADCHLLFTKEEDLWVIYPGVQECCRLCGADQGCTVLKPDWLTGGELLGTETIEGRECAGWAKRGAVAAADTWYQDKQGVPCRYHEVVVSILHNLTFTPASFSTAPIPHSVFQLPGYCQKECPHPYHPPSHLEGGSVVL